MDLARRVGGWQPDLPDHRDYTVAHRAVRRLMRGLKPDPDQSDVPDQVDWREYCTPVEEQGRLPTSGAHACAALLQYFRAPVERENDLAVAAVSARRGTPFCRSRQPADRVIAGYSQGVGPFRSAARATLALSAGGVRSAAPAVGLLFFAPFKKLRFLRLDGRQQSGGDTLRTAKGFLAAGFPFVLGFPVTTAMTRDAEIPFPAVFDRVLTGMAVLAIGYDDSRRVHSDKGAILIRNSWGKDWGNDGYGWLPYSYIRERMAVDLWTLVKRSWLKSGEFHQPQPLRELPAA